MTVVEMTGTLFFGQPGEMKVVHVKKFLRSRNRIPLDLNAVDWWTLIYIRL